MRLLVILLRSRPISDFDRNNSNLRSPTQLSRETLQPQTLDVEKEQSIQHGQLNFEALNDWGQASELPSRSVSSSVSPGPTPLSSGCTSPQERYLVSPRIERRLPSPTNYPSLVRSISSIERSVNMPTKDRSLNSPLTLRHSQYLLPTVPTPRATLDFSSAYSCRSLETAAFGVGITDSPISSKVSEYINRSLTTPYNHLWVTVGISHFTQPRVSSPTCLRTEPMLFVSWGMGWERCKLWRFVMLYELWNRWMF